MWDIVCSPGFTKRLCCYERLVCLSPCRRWRKLVALERERHSSLERALETSAETAEELQPQRPLLKEEVPLPVPKVR